MRVNAFTFLFSFLRPGPTVSGRFAVDGIQSRSEEREKESGSVHLDPTTGFHPPLRGRGTRVVGLIQVLTLLISSFHNMFLCARSAVRAHHLKE